MDETTKAGHTPGPWEEREWAIVDQAKGRRVAWVGFGSGLGCSKRRTNEEREANARLIVAAPDLLEATKAVMEWARTPGSHGGNPYLLEFVKRAQAAFTKATGEKA